MHRALGQQAKDYEIGDGETSLISPSGALRYRLLSLLDRLHTVDYSTTRLNQTRGQDYMPAETRQLRDLVSIGPAMLKDFELLGINSVAQLRRRSPEKMYKELCRLRGQRLDPCCLDVFVAAVAQAKDPQLPIEQRQWWYWSKVRKNI
jgi:hypothetical protein